MIRHAKGAEPLPLQRKRLRYQPRIEAALAAGDRSAARRLTYRYKHALIRERLRLDSHDKCIYCESKVSHQYVGDIEHILPKHEFPQLAYAWSNLGYSCWRCNNHKRKQFDSANPILNAYQDDPKQFLVMEGPDVKPLPNQPRGETTIRLANLQRTELWARRRDVQSEIAALVEIWRGLTGIDRAKLEMFLRSRASTQMEFSLLIGSFLDSCGVP